MRHQALAWALVRLPEPFGVLGRSVKSIRRFERLELTIRGRPCRPGEKGGYRGARRAVIDGMIGRLQHAAGAAVDALERS
jgi:hypothetical protein